MASENRVKFDLSTICNALGRVETKWFKIGVSLGIPRHQLKQFKKDEEDPLSAVVECCLQGNATEADQPFSWQFIVEVLKSEYVGEPGLAEDISKKYCQQETKGNDASTDSSQPEPVKKEDAKLKKTEDYPSTKLSQPEQIKKEEVELNEAEANQKSQQNSLSELDPDVKMDLEFILDKNLKQIHTIFATYVDTVRVLVEKKGVTKEELVTFLLSLPATSTSTQKQEIYILSDKEQELNSCKTIIQIFNILKTRCSTFLNYDIFHSILKYFDISQDHERLRYPDHLVAFVEKHKILEFENINPLLKKHKKGTKELVLKLDIETTCRLAKLDEIKKVIADIMGLNPSALELVDIKTGCVVVTFLLPASVADVLFTPNTVFTPQQEDKLRAASVLWIKCNDQTFDFEVKSKRTNPALEKLKEQVTCSVCLGVYTDPKLLQCNHTYCQQCLQGLVQQDQQGQLTLTCPTCRQVTPIPASGVAGLQADFRTNQLLEIVGTEWKEGATAKPEVIDSPEKVQSASLSPRKNITMFCRKHDGKIIEIYCKTCEEAICLKCTSKYGRHQSHSYDELDATIQASLVVADKALITIVEALAGFDARRDEISNQRAAIEEEILNTDIVDVRKTELISQLHQLTQTKIKSLAAQRDQMETLQTQLNRHLDSMREPSNQPEAMLRKINAVKQVKDLTTSIQPGMLEPNTEADMKFYSSLSDCTTDSQGYGLVTAGPLPFKCHSKYYIIAPVAIKSTALLETVDSCNQPLKVSMASITSELVSESTGARVEASVERRGESQYQISYQPTINGKHQLHIKVEGQHIRGSPFPVIGWSPVVEVVGTPIPYLTISGVYRPTAVAVNQKGEVVVAECGGHCVTVFSPSGDKLRSFGTKGSDLGQMRSPEGVAVDGEENILVADIWNHRIQKFTAQGEFLTAVGEKGTGPLQFQYPRDIAFNTSNGRVYVADIKRIQILNSDLSYRGVFEEGIRIDPMSIACDSTGHVYVADHGNNRIQVFTAEGKFLRMFGVHGRGRGELKWPQGVALDSGDRVYVSDIGNRCVSVFTSEGNFVTSFGFKGTRKFRCPYGIAVDSIGVVYVCYRDDNYLQLF